MERLKSIDSAKLGKERNKRAYDLRILNCVSESEYESRMAIWDNLVAPSDSLEEVKAFIDASFYKQSEELKASRRDFALNYNDFASMANEEISYIRVHVADTKSQYFWYATMALVICFVASLYF